MHSVSRLVRMGAPLLGVALALGCNASPIGDPCLPESVPPGGYDETEVYIETSSVQCRTRTCMVYGLEGNPLCEGSEGCAAREAVEDQIFCSCRCSVSSGVSANTPLCACGEGFTCEDDVVVTGGPGVEGGYCVPCIEAGNPRGLDPLVYDECPTA